MPDSVWNMKASIKTLLLFSALTFSAALSALAGPYPGSLKDHGHTGPGDGGQLVNFSVTNAVRASTGVFTQVNIGTTSYPTSGVAPLNVFTDSSGRNQRLIGYETGNTTDILFRNAQNTTNLGFIEGITTSGDGSGTTPAFWHLRIYSSTLAVSNTAELDVSTMGVKIRGTPTNDDAAVGDYGEFKSSVTSGASTVTISGAYVDLLQIHLSSGDWSLSGQIRVTKGTATWTGCEIAISTASGNDSGALISSDNWLDDNWSSSATTPSFFTMTLADVRASWSVAKTYYLKVRSDYSTGRPTVRGRISARRER